jgi:hypothetical protein
VAVGPAAIGMGDPSFHSHLTPASGVTGWWGAPSGTVTSLFTDIEGLFTDIEGSTRPWETQPEMMRPRTTHTPWGMAEERSLH